MMNEAESELRKVLPNFDASNIIGSNIDIFHKDPSVQRNLLNNPRNLPHKAMIDVGPEKLDLLVSSISDQNQNQIGFMLTWDVVTENLRNEEKMTQISNMMENAPTNVVYADLDFNITYINPTSLETLKTVEQYLPVRVEEIMGASIDIFHKNPAHQRKLLQDSRNLPFKGIIDQFTPYSSNKKEVEVNF